MVYAAMWSMARNRRRQELAERRYVDAIANGAQPNQISDGLVLWDGYQGAGDPTMDDLYLAGIASPDFDPTHAGWYSQYILEQGADDYNARIQHTGNLGGAIEAESYDGTPRRTNVTEFRDVEDTEALTQRIEQDYAPVVEWAQTAPEFGTTEDRDDERAYWIANNPPSNVQNWKMAYDTHNRQRVRVRDDFVFEGQSRYRPVDEDNLQMWSPPHALPDDQRWGKGSAPGTMSFDQFERDYLYGYNLTPMEKWYEYNAYKAEVNPNYTVGGRTPGKSKYLTPDRQVAAPYTNPYNPQSAQSRNEWNQANEAYAANSAGRMHDGTGTGKPEWGDAPVTTNPNTTYKPGVASFDVWLAQADAYWQNGSAAHQRAGYDQYLSNMGVNTTSTTTPTTTQPNTQPTATGRQVPATNTSGNYQPNANGGSADSLIHHTNPNAMSAFGSAIVLNPGVYAQSVTWGGQRLVKHGSLDKGREVWYVPNRQRGHSGGITIVSNGQTYSTGGGGGGNVPYAPTPGNTATNTATNNVTTPAYTLPPRTNSSGQTIASYNDWSAINPDNKAAGAAGYHRYQGNMGVKPTAIGTVAGFQPWLAQADDYWQSGSLAHQKKGYNQYLSNMGVSAA